MNHLQNKNLQRADTRETGKYKIVPNILYLHILAHIKDAATISKGPITIFCNISKGFNYLWVAGPFQYDAATEISFPR